MLNLFVLGDGDEYASLADQLEARGFTRHIKDGKTSPWQWQQQIDDKTIVLLEITESVDAKLAARRAS